MRAFLLKLNFGLRDLSYIELGKCGSMEDGLQDRRGKRNRRTTEFYTEELYPERSHKLTSIPMHVHKLEDGVKLGAACPIQHRLHKVFFIEEDLSSGEFELKPNEEPDFRFTVPEIRINGEVFWFDEKASVFRLKHGDVIEFFLRHIPIYMVMFLLADKSLERVAQTSALLSCPWPVLRKIFQFLTPFETMENLIPVCQQFFQLMRSGAIWTCLNFKVVSNETYFPHGHMGDFCKVIAPLERLHVIDFLKDSDDTSIRPFVRPSIAEFLDFFGSGVLRSLSADALPVTLSEADWLLVQRRGTFADLESLTLGGGHFQKMPLAGTMRGVLPKLKSIWFQNLQVSPTSAIVDILEMPSVEKLWFRNVQFELDSEPIPLYFFDRRPMEWLENIKLISGDTWERYIPYSRMINLEFVALFSRDKKTKGLADTMLDGTLPRSLENIFKELSICSKLRGLSLRIPDGFCCTVLNELSQKLEFVAISGANIDEEKSVLECLSENQSHLEEVWIRIFRPSVLEYEDVIKVLMRFKLLKSVVFVCTPRQRPEWDVEFRDVLNYYEDYYDDVLNLGWHFKPAMRDFVNRLGLCWRQVTLTCGGSMKRMSFTYDLHLRRQTEFSSSAFTKFFADWFEYVPKGVIRMRQFTATDLILAVFPH